MLSDSEVQEVLGLDGERAWDVVKGSFFFKVKRLLQKDDEDDDEIFHIDDTYIYI